MTYLALLYDFTESDLARDLEDLLVEFNIGPVKRMALTPSRGRTLDEKETDFLKDSSGVVFLITPGSKRTDKDYPSPSVNHELGQSKQLFSAMPQRVIYLVETGCDLPVIDQKTRIHFTRTDMRSVIAAVTMLVKELKAAGFFPTASVQAAAKENQKRPSLDEIIEKLGARGEQVIMEISKLDHGRILDTTLTKVLSEKLHSDMTKVNLMKRNLWSIGVLNKFVVTSSAYNFWEISDLGWEVVKIIEKKKRKGTKTQLV